MNNVLVPGLTDDAEDIGKTARFVAGSETSSVDVLPLHQMGRYKWHRLKLNYTLEQMQPPSPDLVERTLATFRNEGLKAV